jgi:uncharacterized protein (TIGR00299 family) protein
MKTFIDCGSGIAGDMLLGALLGAGLPARELERMLQAAFRESGWHLKIGQTERQHWPAWSVQVIGDRPYGSIDKMRTCVRRAALPAPVKKNALEIFDRLELAEARAHGYAKGDIDLHGLGLLDTLVDVVGNSWGFCKLGLGKIQASPMNTGRIAPATAVMLKEAKVPVYSTQSELELATPTGVAVLLQFVKEFGPMPPMQLERAGYGAGKQDPKGRPNVVAIYSGLPLKKGAQGDLGLETVLLLETVIDDMDPRLYPHVMDMVLKAGALDTWWSQIGMKKGRPGIAFSVLCRSSDEGELTKLLFEETTTLGIRRTVVERWVLPRKATGLRKIASLGAGRHKIATEYEVARKTAAKRAVPLVKLLK